MCVHYDNDNQVCDMQTDPSTGGLLPPELPTNYYGCLGKKSVERPGIFTEDTSALFSDCFDCTAAILAIGRIVRQSKGKMSYDVAKLIAAEDMYATGAAQLDKITNADPTASGMTAANCTAEIRRRRRLQDMASINSVSERPSDSDEKASLSRPDKVAVEVGRSKKMLSLIISNNSFAALRFEMGRTFYYTKRQNDSDPSQLARFTGEVKRQLRTKCTDECIQASDDTSRLPALRFNGRCDDTGFADTTEGPPEGKCALGTDCSDCTGTGIEFDMRHPHLQSLSCAYLISVRFVLYMNVEH